MMESIDFCSGAQDGFLYMEIAELVSFFGMVYGENTRKKVGMETLESTFR